ncbi:MAG: rhodanese-like domain-containing protein [Spirosomaceae bacterium]|jgi:phage shock protein E|nr:rhodanese-like domain-containing protein [Spirosomataceae bacterium]
MKSLFTLLFVAISIASCAQSGATQHLVPQEFIAKLKATKNAQLLDVRTPEEWNQGKIASSTCINYNSADFAQQVQKLDKNKPVFVYCAVGGRSTKATKILEQAGFKQIFNLTGGGYKDLATAQVK